MKIQRIASRKIPLKAFRGKQELKNEILVQLKVYLESNCKKNRSRKHNDWDGIYQKYVKTWEENLDIPATLFRLALHILKRVPNDQVENWPVQFIEAIKPGIDLSTVWPKFTIWMLTDKTHGVTQYAETEEQRKNIQHVADLYASSEDLPAEEWKTAGFRVTCPTYDTEAAEYATYAGQYAAFYKAADNCDNYAINAVNYAILAASVTDTRSITSAQFEKLLELIKEIV